MIKLIQGVYVSQIDSISIRKNSYSHEGKDYTVVVNGNVNYLTVGTFQKAVEEADRLATKGAVRGEDIK